MSTTPWTDMKIDVPLYSRNRNEVSLEYQEPFLNQHVAWHKEGTHIVAASPTPEGLLERLRELGIPRNEVVCEHLSTDGQF